MHAEKQVCIILKESRLFKSMRVKNPQVLHVASPLRLKGYNARALGLLMHVDFTDSLSKYLLTLGVHAQQGLLYLVRKFFCLSVTTFSATTRNETTKERYQKVQRYTGLILDLAIFVKAMRSTVMA